MRGRLELVQVDELTPTISIHAPMRGRRTVRPFRRYDYQKISIHAPMRGRLSFLASSAVMVAISIHAPMRGRRKQQQRHPRTCCYFNPRPHAGAT